MAQIVVRNLDETVKARLKKRATLHGRSMEEEVRQILNNASKETIRTATGLGSRIAARFTGIGLTTDIPEMRGQTPRQPKF
jgi:plasmid stability protein